MKDMDEYTPLKGMYICTVSILRRSNINFFMYSDITDEGQKIIPMQMYILLLFKMSYIEYCNASTMQYNAKYAECTCLQY